jgi:hypothetical protein
MRGSVRKDVAALGIASSFVAESAMLSMHKSRFTWQAQHSHAPDALAESAMLSMHRLRVTVAGEKPKHQTALRDL